MKTPLICAALALTSLATPQTGHFQPYTASRDLHEAANAKHFTDNLKLAPEARALLQKNLFVVTPAKHTQLYEVYAANDYRDIPSIVTVDSVLHLYHVFYDGLLRQIEQTFLIAKAKRLTKNMLDESITEWTAASDPAIKAPALKTVAYFAVATKLLNQPLPANMPAEAATMVEGELALINAHQEVAASPIFGGKLDYTQFIVRGHYTKSDDLKTYFAAMSWLSEPFSLLKEDGTPEPEAIAESMLVANALQSGKNMEDWNAIYEPTNLFVGSSNTYTPEELRKAATDAFGSATQPDPAKLADFVSKLQAIRKPEIISAKRKTGMNPEVQFSFMGRRTIPDSIMLQRLTGDQRVLPSGLDVMAVLGSPEAARILDADPATYNPKNWADYVTTRDQLKKEFAAMDVATWQSNLYWSWMDTLRTYLQPIPDGFPSFMTGAAWSDKRLSTSLGSWTELRHDTILYGQQTGAEAGDGREPPFVPQFVEPALNTYSRLVSLIQQTHAELKKRGMLEPDAGDHLSRFEETVKFLFDTSAKELEGKKLTKDEHQRIRWIEGEFSGPTDFMLKYGTNIQILTEDDLDMSLIADVHTGGPLALEEGVGHGDDLIAIVPIEGKLYLARGSVFSHYEFEQPIANRLDDATWKKMVRGGKTPKRSPWISAYFSPTATKEKG